MVPGLKKFFALCSLIRDQRTPYAALVKMLYGETPPADHDFLARTDHGIICEDVSTHAYRALSAFGGAPLPHAAIGFLVCYPFQYYIYKTIHRHLPDSEFIINGHWIRRWVNDWRQLIDDFQAFLEREKVPFRVYFDDSDAGDFFMPYRVLVSNFWTHPLDLECNRAKKKVRVMYGQAKDVWTHGSWSRAFDLALTFGRYSNKKIAAFTESVMVGNLRFDDWFGKRLAGTSIRQFRRALDPARKTVLYLPTHSSLSSIGFFAEAAEAIVAKCNLIIRPHPLTRYMEGDRMQQAAGAIDAATGNRALWADDRADLTELLSLADLVVSDSSGAIMDALLADKPIVLFEPESGGRDLADRLGAAYGENLKNAPFEYPYEKSIDVLVKRDTAYRIGEIASGAKELADAIARSLEQPARFARTRAAVRRMVFEFEDDRAGERAAREIIRCMGEPSPARTFLAVEADAAAARARADIQELAQRTAAAAGSYANLAMLKTDWTHATPKCSVVIPTYNRGPAIGEALEAAAAQAGVGRGDFEILVVDDGSSDGTPEYVKSFMTARPEIPCRYVRYEKNHGVGFARNIGILEARGELIAFTDDDCIVPPGWIRGFLSDFEKNPEIAGAGGWYHADPKTATDFDRLFFWQHVPSVLRPMKSTEYRRNKCGNSGNVCYRKGALRAAGGFNPYFGPPSLEDWELKIRLHKLKFPLLYEPRMAIHKKRLTPGAFVRQCLVRGWAGYLIGRIHPDHPEFDMTLRRALKASVADFVWMIRAKKFAVDAPLAYSRRSAFLAPLRNICTWAGRYSVFMDAISGK